MTDVPLRQTTVRDPAATRALVARLRRRSLFIHFWRGALPALIAAGLFGLMGWWGYKLVLEMSQSKRQGGAIRMLKPEFHGRNKEGLPYVVTADTAVRDGLHPDEMHLEQPRLVMQTANRGVVKGAAPYGLNNDKTHILNLWGGVTMVDGIGYHFFSPTARVDTQADTATGHDGTHSEGPTGRAVAESYFIEDKQGHTVLMGHVLTHLIPHAVQPAVRTR